VRPVLLLVAFALTTLGCGAGWRQPAALSPGPMPSRQQVQVWTGGEARRWHAVAVTEDSISGVPFMEPATCLTCRVAVARPAVDSVRLGSPVAGFWKTIGLVLGTSVLLGAIWCETGDGCYVGD
jgi:hypothetical protein